MDLADRIFRLHNILKTSRYPVPRSDLEDRLECSRATVTRVIRDMRDHLGAPIEFDKEYSGYRYAPDGEGSYELPGLWFNASELHALVTVQHLLAKVQPGLLENHIAPLRTRIENILKSRHMGGSKIDNRVRILGMAARRVNPENFRTVAGAVLQRKRLNIVYHSRGRNETTERSISPQKVVHYRDNWYLDAWDHGKSALRSFSIDRIKKARVLDKPVKDIADKKLDEHFATAYGIFGGRPRQKAILRFTAERARWVADEEWHPQQESCFKDGCYELKIPYSDSRELVMDILKHGSEVEVAAPACLRAEVEERLATALARYRAVGRA